MPKPTKYDRSIAGKVEAGKVYAADEGLQLLKEVSEGKRKFAQTVNVAIQLGIDPRKTDQAVRGATKLPHGTGKSVRVAVFAQGDNATAAKDAGAEIVGFEDLAESIKAGNLAFDVLIATPDAMRLVGQLGQVLGPRGLMPNPKTGTVTPKVAEAVKNIKGGQITYRTEKAGIIHAILGKETFSSVQLKENLEALVTDLKKLRPTTAKGIYIKKIAVSSTMSPGIIIDPASLTA